jgi:hypothetical protein
MIIAYPAKTIPNKLALAPIKVNITELTLSVNPEKHK